MQSTTKLQKHARKLDSCGQAPKVGAAMNFLNKVLTDNQIYDSLFKSRVVPCMGIGVREIGRRFGNGLEASPDGRGLESRGD